MKIAVRRALRAAAVLFCMSSLLSSGWPEGLDVTLHVSVARSQGRGHDTPNKYGNVVVWLTPTQKDPRLTPPRPSQSYTMVQKDKQFSPHMLVVPTGSSVDFPNLDPFFHNVFSLFNGKRFDLGLYEAHTHRKVQFDREGVSYIFCNIHPEMAAVVLALSTPYYGISSADGSIVIRGVEPGAYEMNVWAENVGAESLHALGRTVEINRQHTQLDSLRLQVSQDIMNHHKNKFGENYTPPSAGPY